LGFRACLRVIRCPWLCIARCESLGCPCLDACMVGCVCMDVSVGVRQAFARSYRPHLHARVLAYLSFESNAQWDTFETSSLIWKSDRLVRLRFRKQRKAKHGKRTYDVYVPVACSEMAVFGGFLFFHYPASIFYTGARRQGQSHVLPSIVCRRAR
jgi:hypothetical protein